MIDLLFNLYFAFIFSSVTGRGGGKKLKNWADTVSEVRDIKHAFNSQIMARKGVDY